MLPAWYFTNDDKRCHKRRGQHRCVRTYHAGGHVFDLGSWVPDSHSAEGVS